MSSRTDPDDDGVDDWTSFSALDKVEINMCWAGVCQRREVERCADTFWEVRAVQYARTSGVPVRGLGGRLEPNWTTTSTPSSSFSALDAVEIKYIKCRGGG